MNLGTQQSRKLNMRNNLLESVIGFVVILVAIIFFIYSYSMIGNKSPSKTYEITAVFNEVSGLISGSDVRLSGIKIGSVSSQTLDIETFEAIVSMQISNDIKLPSDSSAKISSEGLLGGNYISIEPGGSDEILIDGDVIEFTQGSIDLIGLLGNAVFGS